MVDIIILVCEGFCDEIWCCMHCNLRVITLHYLFHILICYGASEESVSLFTFIIAPSRVIGSVKNTQISIFCGCKQVFFFIVCVCDVCMGFFSNRNVLVSNTITCPVQWKSPHISPFSNIASCYSKGIKFHRRNFDICGTLVLNVCTLNKYSV